MLRRLFTAASIVSLLLCVAIIALWVRSYSVADRYLGRDVDWAFEFDSNTGALCFAADKIGGDPDDRLGFQRDKPYPRSPRVPEPGEPGVRSSVKIPGISWFAADGGDVVQPPPDPPGTEQRSFPLLIWDSAREVTISYWLLTVLAGALPAPTLPFSRPARRSLTLGPDRSPDHHLTFYIEDSGGFVASTAAPIATGWSDQLPGGYNSR